jgi:hypothetical protein
LVFDLAEQRMNADEPGWLEQAYLIYSEARRVIERWKGMRPDDTELDFYIEDLKDALLDLKEATIDRNQDWVAESMDEISALILEIRNLSSGDE